jgi:rhamnulokinase
MSRFYVACDLDTEKGRLVLGTLHKDQLTISEVRRFPNTPLREKEGLQWNIPQLYENIIDGLRSVGSYEEPVESISFSSWGSDYLLFESDGSLITPAFHHQDNRVENLKKNVLAGFPPEMLYEETGTQRTAASTVLQLAAEIPKRLKRAAHLLPIADGFNFLFSGVPHMERSSASCTQLYNPVTHSWSERILSDLHLPGTLLPTIVDSATELGPLRPDLARELRLEDARIVASCSDRFAAALAGLPAVADEDWAFLQPGKSTLLGTQLGAPLISEPARKMGFTNGVGYGGSVHCFRPAQGFSILDECQKFWRSTDREMDAELLSHLAGSAPPFESLIDPTDPRFSTPGDMPLKIQAFCKETGQAVPRRPGPIFRCILESLALSYRKSLQELELITGVRFSRLFVLGQTEHPLLNHFTANAVRIPTVIVGEDAAPVGNIVLQGLSLRHFENIQHARDVVRSSIKNDTIIPYATAWDAAYDRLVELSSAEVV